MTPLPAPEKGECWERHPSVADWGQQSRHWASLPSPAFLKTFITQLPAPKSEEWIKALPE